MKSYITGISIADSSIDYTPKPATIVVNDGLIDCVLPPNAVVPSDCIQIDLSGQIVMAGFVQTHVHLVQTLFKGLADDLPLLDWLKTRIWPLEAAHDEESVYWSARLGITEMLLSGTVGILDMATVRHTDSVFSAAQESGIRAHIGKTMMDRENEAGLSQALDLDLQQSDDLRVKWHGTGRLNYAFAPRFVPSCSEELLTKTRDLARSCGALIHTHASENVDEVKWVRDLTGRDNILYLGDIGLLGPDVVLAHCIHLSNEEVQLLGSTKTNVSHCPSSNHKLGSGLAHIPELIAMGINCSIGADGAPCNNRMDMFTEMRLAALMQGPRVGCGVLSANDVLDMATVRGSETLGFGAGVIQAGQPADFISLDMTGLGAFGGGDLAGKVVYSMTAHSVKNVWIGGEHVVNDGKIGQWDFEETIKEARRALERVVGRVNL